MDDKRFNEILDYFKNNFPRTEVFSPASEELIEKYRGKVADALLRVWEQEGFRAYGDGAVWLTNPDEYREVLKYYLKNTSFEQLDKFHVFKRGAFGDLYAVGEVTGHKITINVYYNSIFALEKEMRTISDDKDLTIMVCLDTNKDDVDCEDYLEEPLFDRAFAKFGMLKADEVYAFNPLLIQATQKEDLSLEHIVVKNIFDYIREVRAVAMPSVPFAGVHVDTDNV